MNEILDTTKIRTTLEEKRREDKITVDVLELGRNKVELSMKCGKNFFNCLKSLKNTLTQLEFLEPQL